MSDVRELRKIGESLIKLIQVIKDRPPEQHIHNHYHLQPSHQVQQAGDVVEIGRMAPEVTHVPPSVDLDGVTVPDIPEPPPCPPNREVQTLDTKPRKVESRECGTCKHRETSVSVPPCSLCVKDDEEGYRLPNWEPKS
ncbi:unnamed protein product, partial [marine sediment metagenome]